MLADSYLLPECIVRPGSFVGLLTLYEGNFIKLNQLVPNLFQCKHSLRSRSPEDFSLHLLIEEQTKYTRLVRLTYLFEEGAATVADPDLCARVYLDARMVDVTNLAEIHRHEVLRGLRRHSSAELDHRWARNMMFGKWLDYLLERRHTFIA